MACASNCCAASEPGRESSEVTARITLTAQRYQGVPYVWGGTSPGGFDCSGFTQYVFALNRVKLPRTADVQFEVGIPVRYEQLQPGDLVFFSTYERGPSHNEIYLGSGRFISASSSRGVAIDRLDSDYWSSGI
jgi:cell wall-associated NlpC family hydrolase